MDLNNRIVVSIKMKPYLKAFFLALFDCSKEPVFMPKKDKFNEVLAHLLRKQPPNYIPKPDNPDDLHIILPYFEYLHHYSFTYLSNTAQSVFEKSVHVAFIATYRDYMLQSLNYGISKIDSITLFMEEYNIPSTSKNEDMLSKLIYRDFELKKKYPKRKWIRRQ